ncbi:MAG: glycosyltransferase family 2 protein [Candidatus Bilamarchaeaceae archaeon]
MVKISLCFGAMNEKKAIKKVIEDAYKYLGKDVEIIVVDSSKDTTPEIAENLGAKVIRQPPQGYGIALRTALQYATGDVIITIDCDDTYPMEIAPKMVEMIEKGEADVVSGSRLLGKKRVEAMPLLNEIGNRLFAFMVSILYGFQCTDATTGFRAFRSSVIKEIEWTENIGLSLELVFKPAVLGYKVIEIPIDYRARKGETKLNPLKGGLAMLKTIIKYKIKPIKPKTSHY